MIENHDLDFENSCKALIINQEYNPKSLYFQKQTRAGHAALTLVRHEGRQQTSNKNSSWLSNQNWDKLLEVTPQFNTMPTVSGI